MTTISRLTRFIFKAPLFTLAALASLTPCGLHAAAKEFSTGTEWLTPGDWNPTGTPGTGDNVVIDGSSPSGGTYTLTAGSLNVEDITFTLGTTTNLSNPDPNTPSTLTLNGGRGSAVPLIDVNANIAKTTFSIGKAGTAQPLNIVLGVSGTFRIDNVCGLTIVNNISEATAGTSLTIANTPTTGTGIVTLSGTNTFSGGLIVTGSEVDVTADASLGKAGGSVTINGGRLGIATNSFTVDPTRPLLLGANPTGGNTTGTLSIKGSITTTFSQGFQNLNAGTTGDLVKQGGGTLQLGGASTYSGGTFLNNGTTQLTTGNNRLPTTTTVNLGQTASVNTGTLDLNNLNQQVAGLVSVTGTGNTGTTKNTVTVVAAGSGSTLTLGGGGTYAYGDGTATNSGVITGAVSIAKTGTGTQTLGDNNTYTGTTTISAGTLIAGTATTGSGVQALGGTSGVVINGGGMLQMGASSQFNATTPAPLTLNGTSGAATFSVNGFNQGSKTANGIGALTLATGSTSNVIDFGGKAGVITFTTLAANSATLTINNYINNNAASGGMDELIFKQDQSVASGTGFVNNVVFTGYGATTETALGGGFYEVYPVPEPATGTYALICGGLVGLVLWARRRRRQTA